MTYLDRENSAHGGEPVELYRFNIGTDEWLYTSCDGGYTRNGLTYARTHIERGELSATDEAPRETLEVKVKRDNPVAALFNSQAPDGTLYLTILREHRGDSDFIILGKWRVLRVTWAGSEATLVCEPRFTALVRSMLRMRFAGPCRHDWGDEGCTVSKSDYAVPAVLIAATGVTMRAAAFAAKPDGYFKGGKIDAGLGRQRRIVSHVGDTVTLTSTMPGIGAGAEVTAYPYCDKLIDGDCLNRYNNTPNHGGFPNVPNTNPFETGLS